MAKVATLTPINQYFDLTGAPLDAGFLFFGLVSQDPEQFPASMFWDAAGTVPALQPIRTVAGYPARNGAPAIIYGPDEYSLRVKTSASITVFYAATLGGVATAASLTAFIASLAATTGATLIGWIRTATGAVATTLSKWLNRQPLSVTDFMTDAQIADTQLATPVLNHTVAIQAFRDALVTGTRKKKGVFPPGTYRYDVSPNWAIQDVEVIAEGEVRLRYFGTGNALIFDAGATAPDLVYNVRFGAGNKFHLEAPATAGHGVYVRSVHHSKIGVNVHGCGTTKAGLRVEFAVVTEFDVTVSGNEGGWYLAAKPGIGYQLDQRLAAETTSYCYFPNPIVEGVPVGIELVNTLGNVFMGGTSEGCTTYGVLAGVGALNDKFIGTDFEVNTVADVFCNGLGIAFLDCDSSFLMAFGSGARRCILRGGQHQSIDIQAGALATTCKDTTYNRFTSTGTMTDAGTKTCLANIRNGSGTLFLEGSGAYDPPNIANNSSASNAVTVAGLKFGDIVEATFNGDLAGLTLTAYCNAPGFGTAVFTNNTGAAVDLGSATLRLTGRREG